MARRRRAKHGIEITNVATGPADMLGSILGSQNSVMPKPKSKMDENENIRTDTPSPSIGSRRPPQNAPLNVAPPPIGRLPASGNNSRLPLNGQHSARPTQAPVNSGGGGRPGG